MLSALKQLILRFRKEDSGLSALEFAIIVPVMLTSLLGAVELSNGMLADRKVTLVTSTIADLTAQDTNVTSSDMADIWAAGAAVMHPMGAAPLRMRISSVVADSNGVTRVEWSCARSMTARAANSSIVIPAGMVAPNGSVIFAEVEYLYTSAIGELLTSGVTVRDSFYLRPRRSLKVTRTGSCPA